MNKRMIAIGFSVSLLLSGCAGNKMNQLEKQYSEKEVTKLAEDYIKSKYEEVPQIKKITAYQDVSGGMDATSLTAFKGYALETEDYLIFMDFASDGTYIFSDTKQSEDILQDMRAELDNVYSGKAYLSMLSTSEITINDGNTELPYLLERSQSYQTYYDGSLSELFSKENNIHDVYIYMDAADDRKEIDTILNAFDLISPNVTVTEFEPGLFDELQSYFDDWDHMKKVDQQLYYRRKGNTGTEKKLTEVPFTKIADGIYVKSRKPVHLYQDIEEGLEQITSIRPDSVEALFVPDGSEKGILVSDDLSAFYVLTDLAEQGSEISFYDIGKEGSLYEEEEKQNELLCSYEEIQGTAAVIYGGSGYLVVK